MSFFGRPCSPSTPQNTSILSCISAQNPTKQVPTDEQGSGITETASSNDDSFEDAVNDTSSQVDIFDMLSGTKEMDIDTAGMNKDSEANSGDGMPTPIANTTLDNEESTSTSSDSKNNTAAKPKSNSPFLSLLVLLLVVELLKLVIVFKNVRKERSSNCI